VPPIEVAPVFEDYLYPGDYFVPIAIPEAVERVFDGVSRSEDPPFH
jgi:hypothetical protein